MGIAAEVGRGFRAEWGKAWSVRSTWGSLLAGLLLMAGSAATFANDFLYNIELGAVAPGSTLPLRDALVPATQLTQFAVIALAMLVVTSEFSTGSWLTTLQAAPRRGVVLAAKALVVAVIVVPAGLVLGALGAVVARLVLGVHAVAAGVPGDVARVTLYLLAVALLTVGIGAALRSAVGTLSVALVVLVGLVLVSNPVTDHLPAAAGAHLLANVSDPYSPVVAALLLFGWAAVALVAGALQLRRRDA